MGSASPGRQGQPAAVSQKRRARPAGSRSGGRLYGALDLGTNNCRLLIAEPRGRGFRVVEAFSEIVRLGEDMKRDGQLQQAAMDRAVDALRSVSERMARRENLTFRCVTTQACREAANGKDFIERVRLETGIQLEMISPREEARLAVLGCSDLLDHNYQRCLVIDIGGGSSEISQVEIAPEAERRGPPKILRWSSSPIGVVNLAERHPEIADREAWYEAMLADARTQLQWPPTGVSEREAAEACGNCYVIGTSGTVTSLAGVHLKLPRYDRRHIDGVWLDHADMRAAIDALIAVDHDGRAQHPCVGPQRADLVLAGCAIFEAVLEQSPCERIRVADRGLREGILISLMQGGGRRKPRRRKRNRSAPRSASNVNPASASGNDQ
jgi:exopolyphosphatase/guanosine-5'-triphosphate,3'-diphosphate pyrophosphatase